MQEYHYKRFSQSSDFSRDALVDLSATKLNNGKKVIPVNLCEQMKNKCHSSPFDFVVSGNTDPVLPESCLKDSLTLTPSQCAKRLKVTENVSVRAVFIKREMMTLDRCRLFFSLSLVRDLTCVLRQLFPQHKF